MTQIANIQNLLPTAFFEQDFDLKQINPAQAYLSSLSKSGMVSMRSRLNNIARSITGFKHDNQDYLRFNWGALRRFHVEQLLNNMRLLKDEKGMPIYSPGHLKTTFMCLRGVCKQSYSLGLINSEEYTKIQTLKFDFGKALQAGRALMPAESKELINALESGSIRDFRDATILSLLAGTGMRRHELAGLMMANYDREGSKITFSGKGGKVQEKHLQHAVARRLNEWIDDIRGDEEGTIFCGIYKNDTLALDKPLTGSGVYKIVKKHAPDASPHDFRRGLATYLLDKQIDIVTVRDALSHSSISTTQIYVRKDEQAIKDAVNQVDL